MSINEANRTEITINLMSSQPLVFSLGKIDLVGVLSSLIYSEDLGQIFWIHYRKRREAIIVESQLSGFPLQEIQCSKFDIRSNMPDCFNCKIYVVFYGKAS